MTFSTSNLQYYPLNCKSFTPPAIEDEFCGYTWDQEFIMVTIEEGRSYGAEDITACGDGSDESSAKRDVFSDNQHGIISG